MTRHRRQVFIKNDVACNKEGTSDFITQAITFGTFGVPKKDYWTGVWAEFDLELSRYVHETTRPEYLNV